MSPGRSNYPRRNRRKHRLRRDPGPGSTNTKMQEQAAHVQQMETHYPSLQIRGFGDVDFSATDLKGTTSGFNLGQLDLHLASALSRKVTYFGELTFNAHPDRLHRGSGAQFIRYDYNDYFKISFGRYHTPIGYWNTAFHHGAWLQTTITRPDIVRFGGTFIPIHFVGFLAEGNIPSGGAGLSYNVGVGNGRGNVIFRPGDAGDTTTIAPGSPISTPAPGDSTVCKWACPVIATKITLMGRDFREWIADGYLVWTKETPEFLAEFVNVNHRQVLNDISNEQSSVLRPRLVIACLGLIRH